MAKSYHYFCWWHCWCLRRKGIDLWIETHLANKKYEPKDTLLMLSEIFGFSCFNFETRGGGGGQTITYLNARVIYTLLYTWKIYSGSIQLVFSPCIYPVHNKVSRKIIKTINSKHDRWKCIFTWYRQNIKFFGYTSARTSRAYCHPYSYRPFIE